MKKLIVFAAIFILIVSTSLIKNSTKDLDDQIYSLRENILFLENRLNDLKLEFDYLSSPEKLLEYQKLYFEKSLVKKTIQELKTLKFQNKKTLKWFKSSKKAKRGFCSKCGASIFFKFNKNTLYFRKKPKPILTANKKI